MFVYYDFRILQPGYVKAAISGERECGVTNDVKRAYGDAKLDEISISDCGFRDN